MPRLLGRMPAMAWLPDDWVGCQALVPYQNIGSDAKHGIATSSAQAEKLTNTDLCYYDKEGNMSDEQVNWVKIMESEMGLEIEVASAALHDAEIPNIVINKQDSAYVVIGSKELHVPQQCVIKAKAILNTGEED